MKPRSQGNIECLIVGLSSTRHYAGGAPASSHFHESWPVSLGLVWCQRANRVRAAVSKYQIEN